MDIDRDETQEWIEALDSVLARDGKDRASYLLNKLFHEAALRGVKRGIPYVTPYKNTIAPDDEAKIDRKSTRLNSSHT